MFTLCSPRVENMRPAIPTMFFISAPTKLRIAILSKIVTSPHSSSSSFAFCMSSTGILGEWMAMDT